MSDAESRKQRAKRMANERAKAEKRQRNLITVGIVVVVIALIGAGGYAIKSANDEANKPSVKPANAATDHFITVSGSDLGGKTGTDPVPVDLYVDLQCPACKAFEGAYGTQLEDLAKAGTIDLKYKVVNFLKNSSTTEYSTRAANTAMCVLNENGPGDFYKLVKQLYVVQPEENTAGLPDEQLVSLGVDAGAKESTLSKCVKDRTYEGWIEESTAQFSDKYGATPTVVIDGKQVNLQSFDSIEKAIKAAAK